MLDGIARQAAHQGLETRHAVANALDPQARDAEAEHVVRRIGAREVVGHGLDQDAVLRGLCSEEVHVEVIRALTQQVVPPRTGATTSELLI